MEYAIETNNLVKRYGSCNVIDNLSIHVPVGMVYGFLGSNGSGKTTTIRIIMGLIKADSGKVKIFGADMDNGRLEAVRSIGAIVETPGAYDNLSAFENLEITARMHRVDRKRIGEVLDLVGLSEVGSKKAGKFSLGMRQRLGIANSLLHRPRILILDEPTNGLDPMGIIEMRKLIRDLSKAYGITVLISSHLLNEVQQLADYIGIIDSGRLLVETGANEISDGEQSCLLIETDRMTDTIEILKSLNLTFEKEKGKLRVFCSRSANGSINACLVNNGIFVYSLESVAKTLEERFLSITGEVL